MLAACAARRWLARSAAGVRLIGNQSNAAAPACSSLVSCLPALEVAVLKLRGPVGPVDLGCLLEALAWCPCLKALSLNMHDYDRDWVEPNPYLPFPAQALASLSSLMSLVLHFGDDPYTLVDVVGALVPLAGLVKLYVGFSKPAVVPAALGQLKALRVLGLYDMCPCALEAGCLDLPGLQGLEFWDCRFSDVEVLTGVSALQRLSRVECLGCDALHGADPQLAQLPGLQRLVLSREPQFEDPTSFRSPPGPVRAADRYERIELNAAPP